MPRKIRVDFAFPSIAALGRNRVSVDDHKRMVNFIAVLAKIDKRASNPSDKHRNRRNMTTKSKTRKGAHKRGPCFYLQLLYFKHNTLNIKSRLLHDRHDRFNANERQVHDNQAGTFYPFCSMGFS